MRIVNRTVVVLHPRAPFIDWVVNTLQADAPVPRASVSEPCNSYLLPPFEDMGAKERYLKQYYRQMFEAELDVWITDPELWPERNLRTFRAWFHATFHELVYDLAPGVLMVEEDP
jgi:hypothetical protein